MSGADTPHRVQLRRTAGWRMPPNTVSVARPTRFGNPWTVAAAIEAGYPIHVQYFREWVTDQPGSLTAMLDQGEHLLARLREGLPGLRGKNLACWCPLDQPCHADVLLELANAPQSGEIA
jgi:hypothetical protein